MKPHITNISTQKGKEIVEYIYHRNPEKFILIQIGANDGWMCDRMYEFVKKYDPKAIMLEPIPCYFEVLKSNYKNNKNLIFEQLALDVESGEKTMHYIPEQCFIDGEVSFRLEHTPWLIKEHWARGLGSFYEDKNNLGCPELKKFSTTIDVKTTTWDELFKRHKITSEHNLVVQTDCEGHDYQLLKSFDFNKVEPLAYISEIYAAVRYPLSHPRYKPHPTHGRVEYKQEGGLYTVEDEIAACEIFSNRGYAIFRENDLFAVKKDILKNENIIF